MEKTITGLHHVTCIASDPQAHLDFYTKVLGLRLVKLTVNFDDPSTYHTYFGDDAGSPGTLMTFFPWPGAHRGRVGNGQTAATAFSIPRGSAGFWVDRLNSLNITAVERMPERFGDSVVRLADTDGLPLELIESASDARPGRAAEGVPVEHSIRGFHSVTLALAEYAPTERLLTETMGLKAVGEEGDRFRFAAGEGSAGTIVDLLIRPGQPRGLQGAGTVHHIAWRTPDFAQHEAWQRSIEQARYNVTEVIDRTYFHSIYFREPGGVLFEIASDPPGMAIDEPAGELGQTLRLPPQYEQYRQQIEAALPKLVLPGK